MIKNIKHLSPGIKASIAFFFASMITKGIAYITTPLYTRLLTTEEYGQTSIFFTWLEIFGIIAMFCLSYGVFNNGMVDYPEKRDEYSFSMLILSNIITLCISGVMFILYPSVNQYIGLEKHYIVLMFIIYFFQPAYNFWIAKQRYEYKYKAVVVCTVLTAVISPFAAILLMMNNPVGSRLFSRIFGAEIVLICFYMIFYVVIGIKAKFRINMSYWKTAILFNLPLIPHYLSTYLLGSSDRIMISYFVSNSATAYYSLAYTVASISLIVWTAINGSLIPFTYEKCKSEDYSAINKVTIPILTMFAICSLLVILFAPEVVTMLGTDDYYEAIYVIPPVVGGVFFQVQYFVYSNIVYYYKKPKYVMMGSVIAVILNLILNYVFIRQFGYIAAAYTTLICYMIQVIIDYIGMKRVVQKDVYDMRTISILSVLVIVVSLLSNLIYNNQLIRYCIAIIIMLGFIKMRDRILNIIKSLKNND